LGLPACEEQTSVFRVALASVCAAALAPGATLTVTNANDSGLGSLRQVIATASAGDAI